MCHARVAPVHSRRQTGFTLLELMVVLAISAILATMAVGTLTKTQYRSEMVGVAHDVRSAFAETRLRAVRTGRFHKICLFSDPRPGDDVGLGRILVFGCNGRGSSCTTAPLCDNVSDSTTYVLPPANPLRFYEASLYDNSLFDETRVEPVPAVGNGTCSLNNTLWCKVAVDGYQVSTRSKVSIAAFGGPPAKFGLGPINTARTSLEVTYGPNGLVIPSASTAPTYGVRILHGRYCDSAPGVCQTGSYLLGAVQFQNQLDVTYTFGGGVRVNRR